MTTPRVDDDVIGYSALHQWDECYEHNEDACYIADDVESLKRFLRGAMLEVADYWIRPAKLSDMLEDFGCSCGEYALEPGALDRFKQLAKGSGSEYSVEPFDTGFGTQDALFIVNLTRCLSSTLGGPQDTRSKIERET